MSEREAARELIRELLAEALAGPNGHGNGNGNGPAGAGGPAGAPATYPPAPVAAVHRPSTWAAPGAEAVRLDSDEDLDRFVLALLARAEDPRQREAIRSGRVRFTLDRSGAAPPGGARAGAARGEGARAGARAGRPGPSPAAGGAVRVERGAVTERKVDQAARDGARLVLGPGAVLTPLAREKARAKGIAIERER